MFPKLSGNYESELFATFIGLQENKYKKIVDVGCAEGYYAIGLARKYSTSVVYAFDIDEMAQQLTRKMAAINEVTDKVIIDGACSAEWLAKEDLSERSLILSDCEGYEKELFVKENINNLKNCDLVIEMHPMYAPDIREYLFDLFGSTHSLEIVSSEDDGRKIFDLKEPYFNL